MRKLEPPGTAFKAASISPECIETVLIPDGNIDGHELKKCIDKATLVPHTQGILRSFQFTS